MKKIAAIGLVSFISVFFIVVMFAARSSNATNGTVTVPTSGPTQYYVVARCVGSNWQPITGAKIGLSNSKILKTTNSDGVCVFDNLTNGNHRAFKFTPLPKITSLYFDLTGLNPTRTITFVEPNKIYYTWQAAQIAYMDYLTTVPTLKG